MKAYYWAHTSDGDREYIAVELPDDLTPDQVEGELTELVIEEVDRKIDSGWALGEIPAGLPGGAS